MRNLLSPLFWTLTKTCCAATTLMLIGCQTPGDTAFFGGVLGGLAPFAKTAQAAASMSAMGAAASGYANAQAGQGEITVNKVQLSQLSNSSQQNSASPWRLGTITSVTELKMGDESVYSGQVRESANGVRYPHGVGRIRRADGSEYVGEFDYGRPHGQGTGTWLDGRKYTGEWSRGERHGSGVMSWVDGDRYEGEYCYGEPGGNGTFTYASGAKYKGEFLEGKFNGQGVYAWTDGRQYKGIWLNGNMNGRGKMTYPDGRVEEGWWKDGKFQGR